MAAGEAAPGRGPVAAWLQEEDLQCPICIGLLTGPTTLLCGHSFCRGCIRQWGEGERRRCPNCGRCLPKRLPERNVVLELVLERYRGAAAGCGALSSTRAPPPPPPPPLDVPRPAGAVLQDMVKINELPQQVERTLETIANWSKDSTEMMDYVSRVKRSVAEAFDFLKTYVNDQEKMVLDLIDKEYVVVKQKRNIVNQQLTVRINQLLELQNEEMKNTSLEEEIYVGDPIKVNEVTVSVQKISSIACIVEEFRRNLENLLVGNYLALWPNESTSGTSQIQSDAAENETASSSSPSQSQNSLPEPSCSSSIVSSPTDTPASTVSSRFSQWATDVTFDLKRINNKLELSEDKRKVIVSPYPPTYEHSAKRFRISQVMGSPGFSEGCHYWEVSTKDAPGWAVGLAYEAIGSRDQLGRTGLSWCIEWSNCQLSAWHGNEKTDITQERPLQVGVFLDIPRNRVSFYSPMNNETCLHTFEINVANALYPAFWILGLDVGNSLTINKIERC